MDHLTNNGSPTAEIVTPAKMDAALKAKWVEALRSGEFKQGRFYFKKDEMFCCLGVLCTVAGEPITREHPEFGDEDNWPFVEGAISSSGRICELVDLNDDERKTFPEIADYIEQNL